MGQLIVTELDDAVEERLKARARRHGRSLDAEARAILAEAANESGLEEAAGEGATSLLRKEEEGLGDLMYEHFKDRGLTDEELARFNAGIAEINSRSAMGIPDFEADEFEETPPDK